MKMSPTDGFIEQWIYRKSQSWMSGKDLVALEISMDVFKVEFSGDYKKKTHKGFYFILLK